MWCQVQTTCPREGQAAPAARARSSPTAVDALQTETGAAGLSARRPRHSDQLGRRYVVSSPRVVEAVVVAVELGGQRDHLGAVLARERSVH